MCREHGELYIRVLDFIAHHGAKDVAASNDLDIESVEPVLLEAKDLLLTDEHRSILLRVMRVPASYNIAVSAYVFESLERAYAVLV